MFVAGLTYRVSGVRKVEYEDGLILMWRFLNPSQGQGVRLGSSPPITVLLACATVYHY